MSPPDAFDDLLLWAEQQALTSPEMSKGLCLHASVGLVRKAIAAGQGGQFRFVRWRVLGDAAFREHWAVSVDGLRVLDLTAVQVDGSRRVLRPMQSYPRNYTAPRLYPPALVLAGLPADAAGRLARYPRRTIWQMHARLAAFDMREGLRRAHVGSVLGGVAHLVESSYVLAIDYLLGLALHRLGRLLSRLG